MESGRRNGVPGVGGDPCVPNEKSPKIDLCSLVEGLPVRPLAIRCGVCAGQLPFDTPRGQGAPSTIRCIKTAWSETLHCGFNVREHPAPSGALRRFLPVLHRWLRHFVREHPAPSGALRRACVCAALAWACQRGHGTTVAARLSGLVRVPVGIWRWGCVGRYYRG